MRFVLEEPDEPLSVIPLRELLDFAKLKDCLIFRGDASERLFLRIESISRRSYPFSGAA